MAKLKEFLQGKKTYFSAIAMAIVALSGWYLNAISSTEALAILCAAGAAAGLGAKSERVAEALLAGVADVKLGVQQAQSANSKVDPKQLGVDVAKAMLAQLASGGVAPISKNGAQPK
jgi:hypothetical protein